MKLTDTARILYLTRRLETAQTAPKQSILSAFRTAAAHLQVRLTTLFILIAEMGAIDSVKSPTTWSRSQLGFEAITAALHKRIGGGKLSDIEASAFAGEKLHPAVIHAALRDDSPEARELLDTCRDYEAAQSIGRYRTGPSNSQALA